MYLVDLLLLLLWIHAAIATVTCPGQFTLFGEQCLQVLLSPRRTWKQARDKCQVSGTGGKLAELPDTTHIIDYIVTEKISNRSTFWVGAEWNTIAKEFLWITSGSKVGYWDDGEPNKGGIGENCVELVARTGKYNDNNCTQKFSTICEVAVPPVHGEWSPWSAWSTCSPDCQRNRSRSCNAPRPQYGGRECLEGYMPMRTQECTDVNCRRSTYIMIGTTTSVLLVVVIFLSIIAAYFIKKRKENVLGGTEEQYDDASGQQQPQMQQDSSCTTATGGPPPIPGRKPQAQPYYNKPMYDEVNREQNFQGGPQYEEPRTGQNFIDMPVYEEFNNGQNYQDEPMYEESHTGQNYDDMPMYEEFSYRQNNRDGPIYGNM